MAKNFDLYPFQKQLDVDIRSGCYKLIDSTGKETLVEANSAKEALAKSNLPNLKKIEYLGFYSKVILSSNETKAKESPNLDNNSTTQTSKGEENVAQ